MKTVREPAVAGMFYTSSAEKLKSEIKLMLNSAADNRSFEEIFGIVVPHAGYIYSGATAAAAYNKISGKKYKTVIVISPSHREYFPGISIYNGDAYKTPLGIIELDKEKIENITEGQSFIFESIKGHKSEHALEVQLPFLQTVLDEFKLIPIVMGDQRKEFVELLAERLSAVMNDETLIVASSDLSHFHSKESADILDSKVEKSISEFDYDTLLRDLELQNCEACGGGPIAALMKAAILCGFNKAMVLSRTNSGDVTGDFTEVVGYLSAVIYK
jgi:MEMO1 family protein